MPRNSFSKRFGQHSDLLVSERVVNTFGEFEIFFRILFENFRKPFWCMPLYSLKKVFLWKQKQKFEIKFGIKKGCIWQKNSKTKKYAITKFLFSFSTQTCRNCFCLQGSSYSLFILFVDENISWFAFSVFDRNDLRKAFKNQEFLFLEILFFLLWDLFRHSFSTFRDPFLHSNKAEKKFKNVFECLVPFPGSIRLRNWDILPKLELISKHNSCQESLRKQI